MIVGVFVGVCHPHSETLRMGVTKYGLGRYVMERGEEAMERMAKGGFEPVAEGVHRLVSMALEVMGPVALKNYAKDGFVCAVCAFADHYKLTAPALSQEMREEMLLDQAAVAVLTVARDRGFVPKVSA